MIFLCYVDLLKIVIVEKTTQQVKTCQEFAEGRFEIWLKFITKTQTRQSEDFVQVSIVVAFASNTTL